jgi:DNA-binding IclR family transcriptional regulator
MSEKYLAPSVKRAFDILKIISSSREGIGLNEISRKLDIAKSTVHGIISALEDAGAVRRDPATRRYELGLTLFELGRQMYLQDDLREVARPVMEALMEEVQETVFLCTLNRDQRLILVLDSVECRHDLKITSPVGSTLPLFSTAPGKAILAIMDDEEIRKIIKEKGITRYTERSITDPGQFIEEIRIVRDNGYAADYEEYKSGVRAVAAHISGERNLSAAIYVVGFKTSLNKEKMDILSKKVKEAARTINIRIKERIHMISRTQHAH